MDRPKTQFFSDTVPSSSSNSSSDDFFQVDPQIRLKFRVQNSIPKPNGGTEPLKENEKLDVSSETTYRLEESINESPESTSQFSHVTHESSMSHMSPTLSPIIQLMERPGDIDPNRISASIFSRPSTPIEWSVASNDSLFSIHIESNSFSRHRASRIGVDLYKSGEPPKSGELLKSGELCLSGESFKSGEHYRSWELFQSQELYRSMESCQFGEHFEAGDMKMSGDLISFRQTSPTRGVEPNKELDMAKTIGEDANPGEAGRIDEPIYDVPKAILINQVDVNTEESRDSSTTNYHSDGRETSIKCFALPMWSNCCCKRSACSCKWIHWPACSFKWCIWPRCFRNCLSWQYCFCKWPSCHCNCPTLSSCCCKCPSWSSCKCQCSNCAWTCCQCSNCAWACCNCWNREPKKSYCDSSYNFTDGGTTTCNKICPEHQHTISPNFMKASSQSHCACVLCSSSCSYCSCCSRSCC